MHVIGKHDRGVDNGMVARLSYTSLPPATARYATPGNRSGALSSEIDGEKVTCLPTHGKGGNPTSASLVTSHSFGGTTFGVPPYAGWAPTPNGLAKP